MSAKKLAAVALGLCFLSCLGAAAYASAETVPQENPPTVIYREDFSTVSTFGGYTVTDGAIIAGGGYANAPIPDDRITYVSDWEYTMNLTFPEATSSMFAGISIRGVDAAAPDDFTEFAIERTAAGTDDFVYTNKGHRSAITVNAGVSTNFKLKACGNTVEVYWGSQKALTVEYSKRGLISGAIMFTSNAEGVVIDNITYNGINDGTKVEELSKKTVYSEDFSAGTAFGGYIVADGKITVNDGYAMAGLDNYNTFTSDWEYSVDLNFPENAAGSSLIGLSLRGVDAPDSGAYTEFCIIKNAPVYNGDGKRTNFDEIYIRLNNILARGVADIPCAENVMFRIVKTGNIFEIYCGTNRVLKYNNGQSGKISHAILFTDRTGGTTIDNLSFKGTAVNGVEISAEAQQVKVGNTLTITAAFTPADAVQPANIQWYVNDAAVEGQNGTQFPFVSSEHGTYSVKCVMDGIESNVITVNVTKPDIAGVTVTAARNEIKVGETVNITAVTSPENAVEPTDIKWYVGETLQQGANGLTFEYTPKTVGTYSIKCVVDGIESNVITVNVTKPDIAGVTVTAARNEIKVGETVNITAVTSPENAVAPTDIKWYVGETLQQSANGLAFEFTPKTIGTYSIKCVVDGIESNVITVNVIKPDIAGVTVTASHNEIKAGEKVNITAVTSPENAVAPTDIKWYVGATLQQGANGLVFEFVSEEIAEYTVKCVINGIESNSIILKVTSVINIADVKLNAEHTTIHCGEHLNITAVITPSSADEPKAIQWFINGVVKEGENGTSLEFVSPEAGTYEIKCVIDGVESDVLVIKTEAEIAVTKVVISATQEQILTDGETTLTAEFSPLNADNAETVSWYVNGIVREETTRTLTFSSGVSGDYKIKCLIAGVESNEITVKVVKPAITEVNISATESQIVMGETVNITAATLPENAADPETVVWYVNGNEQKDKTDLTFAFIQTIVGEYKIKCIINGVESNEITVTVAKPAVTGITISAAKTEIKIDEAVTVTAAVTPAEADTPQSVEWYVNGELLQNQNGMSLEFSAEKAGEYKIKCAAGEITSNEITVTVAKPAVTGITISAAKTEIKIGEAITVTAAVTPAEADTPQSVEWYVNEKLLQNQNGMSLEFSAEKAGEYNIKCVAGEITSNEVIMTVVSSDEEFPVTLYKEDFSEIKSYGSFSVADGKIKVGDEYLLAHLPGDINYSADWKFSMEVTFPATVTGSMFAGISIRGLDASAPDSYTEFAIERIIPEFDKDGKRTNRDIIYTNIPGGDRGYIEIVPDKAAVFSVIKKGNKVEIYYDDLPALTVYYTETGIVTQSILFTLNSKDLLIDDLILKAPRGSSPQRPAPESVSIEAENAQAEAGTFLIIEAVISPVNATEPESIKWYVNGTLQTGQSGKIFAFNQQETGEYTVKCVMDEKESNEITVTVIEAVDNDEELTETVYTNDFSNIADGTEFGAFTVNNGELLSADGHIIAYLPDAIEFAKNWEFSMEITFPEAQDYGNMFVGIGVRGLIAGQADNYTEFAVKRREPVYDKDNNRLNSDSVYSLENVIEKSGLNIESGIKNTFRVLKTGDKVTVYWNNVKAMTVSYGKTSVISNIIIFTYVASGVKLDNITVKAADILESEKPPISSVNITVNSLEAKVGDNIILNANVSPYNAATPVSIKWYLNGELLEGQNTVSLTYKAESAGKYAFSCEIDGVKSNEKTVEVLPEENLVESGCGSCNSAIGASYLALMFVCAAVIISGIVIRRKKNN